MDKFQEIYGMLLAEFGKQGWWPLTLDGYESRYYVGNPKTDKHRFEIIIGAILTQNTNWKNVEKVLYQLSKNNLMGPVKIKKIKKEKLGELIRSAGYYNQKAERLKIVAEHIIDNYNGSVSAFFDKDITELRKELLEIKGIGPETADSIVLYSAGKPVFVIDAYTKRIFERLGFDEGDYDSWQKLFMDNLDKDVEMFKEYHALLVELGKNHCKTKPACDGCPVRKICNNK